MNRTRSKPVLVTVALAAAGIGIGAYLVWSSLGARLDADLAYFALMAIGAFTLAYVLVRG